jgi:hypothetical protein
VIGFFHPGNNTMIAEELRGKVTRRLANTSTGWSAVAVGASGKAGLMLQTANEQDAVQGALTNCAKQDRDCRIIAIGPFAVEPN